MPFYRFCFFPPISFTIRYNKESSKVLPIYYNIILFLLGKNISSKIKVTQSAVHLSAISAVSSLLNSQTCLITLWICTFDIETELFFPVSFEEVETSLKVEIYFHHSQLGVRGRWVSKQGKSQRKTLLNIFKCSHPHHCHSHCRSLSSPKNS